MQAVGTCALVWAGRMPLGLLVLSEVGGVGWCRLADQEGRSKNVKDLVLSAKKWEISLFIESAAWL